MSEENISLEKYFDAKINALEKATVLAANNMERRLDGMNEFRAQLKDQQSTFINRSEYDIQYKRIEEDIRILRESKAMLEGKASQHSVNIAFIISGVGIFLGIASLLISIFK